MAIKLNIKLIRKVQKAITEEPKRFDIDSWGYFISKHDLELYETENFFPDRLPACGTVACIAGWAAILDAKQRRGVKKFTEKFINQTLNKLQSDGDTVGEGAKLLGLEYSEALRVFVISNWPSRYRMRYRRAERKKDFAEAAEVAVELLDELIEYQGVLP